MLLRAKLTIAGLALLLSLASSGAAQQTQTNNPAVGNPQARQMMRRMIMRHRARLAIFRMLRQLDLTDQQKQQARSIVQSHAQATQPQRQELRQLIQQHRTGTLTGEGQARAKELRQQLIQGRKDVRTQLVALLTPDQKAKLGELIKARRARMLEQRNQSPL